MATELKKRSALLQVSDDGVARLLEVTGARTFNQAVHILVEGALGGKTPEPGERTVASQVSPDKLEQIHRDLMKVGAGVDAIVSAIRKPKTPGGN